MEVHGGSAPKQRKSTSTPDAFDIRPASEHAHLLFDKSENLIKLYNGVAECVNISKEKLTTTHAESLEKDKKDVADMLHAGQELARRQVQQLLKRPTEEEKLVRKDKALFTSERLDEAASLFKVLRDEMAEDDGDNEVAQAIRIHMSESDGLFPVIHNAKKGVKRLAGHLPADE